MNHLDCHAGYDSTRCIAYGACDCSKSSLSGGKTRQGSEHQNETERKSMHGNLLGKEDLPLVIGGVKL
jgi:hypothetical protein